MGGGAARRTTDCRIVNRRIRNAAADRPALGDSGSGAVAAPVPGAKTDPLLGRLAQPQLQRGTHEVHASSVVPAANDSSGGSRGRNRNRYRIETHRSSKQSPGNLVNQPLCHAPHRPGLLPNGRNYLILGITIPVGVCLKCFTSRVKSVARCVSFYQLTFLTVLNLVLARREFRL